MENLKFVGEHCSIMPGAVPEPRPIPPVPPPPSS